MTKLAFNAEMEYITAPLCPVYCKTVYLKEC